MALSESIRKQIADLVASNRDKHNPAGATHDMMATI